MTIGTKIYSHFRGTKVGEDEFGNCYFQHKKFGNKKRWVIYNGTAEASKVPADWHRWLHYTTDEIPDKKRDKKKWEKAHLPNLTGTNFAYLPKGHVSKSGQEDSQEDYQAWKP